MQKYLSRPARLAAWAVCQTQTPFYEYASFSLSVTALPHLDVSLPEGRLENCHSTSITAIRCVAMRGNIVRGSRHFAAQLAELTVCAFAALDFSLSLFDLCPEICHRSERILRLVSAVVQAQRRHSAKTRWLKSFSFQKFRMVAQLQPLG